MTLRLWAYCVFYEIERFESEPKKARRTLFYGSAVLAGGAAGYLVEVLFSAWMIIKPAPTTIGSLFEKTVLAPLTQWVIFALLYVPELVISFLFGLFAGRLLQSRIWTWLGVYIATLATFNELRGGAPWFYALRYLQWHAISDFVFWSAIATVLFLSPVAGCLLGKRLRFAKMIAGACAKCGYDLFGNMSGVCPECGTTIVAKCSPEAAEPVVQAQGRQT